MNGTSTACQPRRRRHKANSVWLDVLRRLWSKGWGPRRIAAVLSDLSAQGCRAWLSSGADPDTLDDHSEPGSAPIPWTPRQVRHWMMYRGRRRREGQTRRRPRPPHPDECRLDPRRRYATERGWTHLLPEWVTGKGWTGGVDLSRRDVDVLSCLRDGGPMTRPEIADALDLSGTARRLYNRRGRPILAKLRRAGLVEIVGRSDGRPVYALR